MRQVRNRYRIQATVEKLEIRVDFSEELGGPNGKIVITDPDGYRNFSYVGCGRVSEIKEKLLENYLYDTGKMNEVLRAMEIKIQK